MPNWLQHVEIWQGCQRCPLAKQRSNICLARGTLPCDVLFIGEAPGISEDAIGQPFVGPAGNRLDQIIERSFAAFNNRDLDDPVRGITYALTNLVACFPREAKAEGDHKPQSGEILECRPRLIEFINIARPRLIVCVGGLSTAYVNHNDTIKCIDITHPAAIMRMPLAQQTMAMQKCIVVLRNAVEDMLQSPITPYREYGANAETTTKRERDSRYDPDYDIPF